METAATSFGVRPAVDRSAVALLDDLPTPALLVHRDQLERNLALMASRMAGPVRLRPHFKTHKTIELARRQLAAGAVGITAATVWEADALAHAGVEDVLIANEVIGEPKLRRASQIAGMTQLTVAVDSVFGAEALSTAMHAAGVGASVLIDVDVGMGRCGVRSSAEALDLAAVIRRLPALELRGVMGYEGHCVLEPDAQERRRQATAAMDRLADTAERLRAHGHGIAVISAGGTGTAAFTGADPRVTEVQAGSYVFMDTAYEQVVHDYPPSLVMLATVVSRHGDTAVLDCGVKTIAASLGMPRLVGRRASVRYVAEEHMVLDVDHDAALVVGDRVQIVTGHCCETVNLHDRLHLVDDGRVVEVWPVVARGAGGCAP